MIGSKAVAAPEGEAERDAFLSHRAIGVMAAVTAVSIANGYFIQPLLPEIASELPLSRALYGLLPALTQIGLAVGLLALLPLADIVSARRVLI